MKRLFDISMTILALGVLSPFLIVVALAIVVDSRGGVFYRQKRVGKNGEDFYLLKFRSMVVDADKSGLLTVGEDARVTAVGRWIRRFKVDELPQLFNILKGEMSIVGPRPEVRKYVELYTEHQKKVLSVHPGLTDLASLTYFDEDRILAESVDPEWAYINKIMPDKLKLNLEYIDKQSFGFDLTLIFKTMKRIVLG